MKNKLFYVILFLGAVAAIATAVSVLYPKAQLGNTSNEESSINLMGSASNLVSAPNYAVFANSTTTGDYVSDGGAVISQLLKTENSNGVLLNISAVAPTATSTLFVRQMGSYDGTNFFEVASSTDAWTAPTTTIDSDPRAIQFDPGTATSTVSFPFYTYGHKYTRFIIWSEGWTGDLDVGVQAWIRAIPFNK